MPSTFTHGVVPAACLVLSAKNRHGKVPRTQWIRLAFIGTFLGNSPDLDIIPGTIWASHWTEIHRNWGHNVFSLIAFTCLGTWLFKKFIHETYRPKYIWLTSLTLVFSHVVFDSMGEMAANGVRRGVPLFWPLSDWEMIAPFHVFLNYEVDKHFRPLIAHIMSHSFWTRSVFVEILFAATVIPSWLLMVHVARRIRNKARKAADSQEELRVAS